MTPQKKKIKKKTAPPQTRPMHGVEYAERMWNESWTYIRTVVDTVREPFLILNKDLCVMAANDSFYRTFQVDPHDTEGKVVYELGNGQWDIPSLRKLLENILPLNSFFKGFEVVHEFPLIGRKVMILNARQVFQTGSAGMFPPIILLAMEDVTEMMAVADKLASQAGLLETKVSGRILALERRLGALEKELKKNKTKTL
jgi:PAS domain-containing protein